MYALRESVYVHDTTAITTMRDSHDTVEPTEYLQSLHLAVLGEGLCVRSDNPSPLVSDKNCFNDCRRNDAMTGF